MRLGAKGMQSGDLWKVGGAGTGVRGVSELVTISIRVRFVVSGGLARHTK